jgi:hypothetical protein
LNGRTDLCAFTVDLTSSRWVYQHEGDPFIVSQTETLGACEAAICAFDEDCGCMLNERCDDGCSDLDSDERNCGACGNDCDGFASGAVCLLGSCTCSPDEAVCGGACANTLFDDDHCGGCGLGCGDGERCIEGACAALRQGLTVTRYNAFLDQLPDFSTLTPQRVVHRTSVTLQDERGDDGFALTFEGLFVATSDGAQGFALSSDDGSRLFIDGIFLIENDGIHANETRFGAIELAEGVHTVRVEYFERDGGEFLQLDAFDLVTGETSDLSSHLFAIDCGSGCVGEEVCGANDTCGCADVFDGAQQQPATSCGERCVDVRSDEEHCGDCDTACSGSEVCDDGTCVCPQGTAACDDGCVNLDVDNANCGGCGVVCEGTDTCFAGNCSTLVNGLDVDLYDGAFDVMPDFSTLTPRATFRRSHVTLGDEGFGDNFALVFRGFFNMPFNNFANFIVSSDDGARLFIDGQPVVNVNGAGNASGAISLGAGLHTFRVEYFEREGAASLQVLFFDLDRDAFVELAPELLFTRE